MESGKGRVSADCPSALYVVRQRALRIDGVGGHAEGMNIENADQFVVAQEMNPMLPCMGSVRLLSKKKGLPYLWFTYGICQKGPAK
jgi:hypothetical protein